jgi:hypothetical protein
MEKQKGNMTNAQMELGFESLDGRQSPNRRHRGQSRAGWWFERMRELVDRAYDWQVAASPLPEQIWFPESRRQVSTAASEQHEICE